MNRKNLLIVTILFLICTILAGLSFYLFTPQQPNKVGQLVFANTSEKGAHFDKFVITTPSSTTTIFLKDGFWRVKEGQNYYANMTLTSNLFIAMNKARYYNEIDTAQHQIGDFLLKNPKLDVSTEQKGILIETYMQDKKLDEIIFGGVTPDKQYVFARNPQEQQVWLAANDFKIPHQTYSWYQQPLLNYSSHQIEAYEFNIDDKKEKYRRHKPTEAFFNGQETKSFSILNDFFAYLTFTEVLPQDEFIYQDFPLQRNLRVTLFNGLITDIELFTNKEQKTFWAKIKISATRLPKMGVNDYINDNRFFYDGWIFKLSPEVGYTMYNSLNTTK